MNKSKILLGPMALLLCLAISGCNCCEVTDSSIGWIESSREIVEKASFIVVGDTTLKDVESELGSPSVFEERAHGGWMALYSWNTDQYVREIQSEEDDIGAFFDPFADSEEDRTLDHAYLSVWLNEDRVVESFDIVGP